MKNYINNYGSFLKTSVVIVLLLFISQRCDQNTSAKQVLKAPAETTLQRLLKGNNWFSLLQPTRPCEDMNHLQDAAKEQHPFAVIVCCSGYRVPPELIFDEAIGDFFVIRTGGNIVGGLGMGNKKI